MGKDNVQNTTMALNGIPFDNLIASPLNACVNAQAQAAYTTMKFINDVGLETKTVDGRFFTNLGAENTHKNSYK